jgi:CheY-like chemotaxis protein
MTSVLVGDDDPLVRMVLRVALERRGLVVTEAGDGDELLALLPGRAYRLCIMDAHMPGAGVQERIDRIRATAPDLPIVVLTGYSAESADLRRFGVRLARKPLDCAALDDVLAEAQLTGASR